MLNAIIRFSIRNKLIVSLFILGWIVWGLIELSKLPIDALPDITSNQVQVITVSPTLASPEVERLITFPIEQASSNIPGIKEIRSISRFGLSVVTIVFDDKTDIYWARQQVNERLVLVKDEIPRDAGIPELAPVTTGLGEIYQYIVRPARGYEGKYSLEELRTIQDWIIRRQLLGTPGVADVSSFGGHLKQYEVSVKPDRLKSMSLTIQDIFDALERNNQNSGGSYIEKGPAVLFIRSEGMARTLEDIAQIPIKASSGGVPVYIRDVGEVRIGYAVRYGAMTWMDKGEVAGAVVLMLKGENASQVIERVKVRMEQIQKTLPEGVEVETFYDRTKMVNRAIQTVKTNLLEGALIVVFVLVFFLGNLRAGLIVASVIPLSMLFAVAMMNMFHVSGNLMSLGALDFGLIVDGAVIIVEAVLHRLYHSKHQHGELKLRQTQMDDAVEQSASRMMNAAVFGQIIILIVYLPILSLVGIEGKMFRPMAQTVAFALIGAFILSLTYVPMITSMVLSQKVTHTDNISDKIMSGIQAFYQRILHKAMEFPKTILAVALGFFLFSLLIASRLGGEFIPELEEGDFAIDARILTGSSLTESIRVSTEASAVLQQFPEVERVVTRIGASEIPTDPMPMEMTDIIVSLKPKEQWTTAKSYDELANKMSMALQEIPGMITGFQYPVQMRFNELIAGARQDVVCKIFGEDLDSLASVALKLATMIRSVEGAKDIYVESVTGLPQIVVRYKRDVMAMYRLSVNDVNRTIRAAFAGDVSGKIYENERRFDLVVRLSQQNRTDINDVRQLLIAAPGGVQLPLYQVADVEVEEGPNQIQREDAKRRIIVGFNTRGRDVQSIVQELQKKETSELRLPSGYYIHYGGQFENLVEAKQRLMIAVPIALFLIYLMLYFAFNSFKYGLLIYTAIPLSAIGGILLLWMRDMPFSISAGVGFIALFGVAVLNGIVLITEFNRLKNETNMDIKAIIQKGTETRLRPVLMTAAVASLGFLPMALSHGAGAEVQRPLATVVIGGLVTATLLTLLVLPVLYKWFEKRSERISARKALSVLLLLIGLEGFGQGRTFGLTSTRFTVYGPGLMVYGSGSTIDGKGNIQVGETCRISADTIPLPTSDFRLSTSLGTPIRLDSLLAMASRQNLTLQANRKNAAYWEALSSKTFELPRTQLGVEYGNINSFNRDTRLFISQGFQMPAVYSRQKDYYQSGLYANQGLLAWKELELAREIRLQYYYLQSLVEKDSLLAQLDTVFARLDKAAALRLKTGETNALEKSSAEAFLQQLRLQRTQLQNDFRAAQHRLGNLVNSIALWVPVDGESERTPRILRDTQLLSAHPFLKYYEGQNRLILSQTAMEKSRLSPEFGLGYSNLSIIGWQSPDGVSQKYYGGGDRFHIGQFTMGIPIFNAATKSRIRAGEASARINLAERDAAYRRLQADLLQWQEEYARQYAAVQYGRETGLALSSQIIQNAEKSLRAGDISYIDWTLLMNQAIQIQLGYLDALALMRRASAELIYLSGNNTL
jgi:cobalt-zinc-cadmium resistance protein CzcA